MLRVKLRTPEQSVEMISLTLRNRGGDAMGPIFGFEYANLQAHHYLTIADMMYCDASILEKFRDGRRAQKNILAGVFAMVGYAFSEPARALTYYMNDRRAQALAKTVAALKPAAAEAPPAAAPLTVPPQLAAMTELVTAVEGISPGAALARVHELMASVAAGAAQETAQETLAAETSSAPAMERA